MNKTYRKDNRTEAQFEKDIKQRTSKEKFLIDLYAAEMEHLGWNVIVKDNGTDNSGKVQDKATADADYLVYLDDECMLIEVKNSWVSTKWTFKTHNLKRYVKAGANILVFWNTGKLDSDPEKIDLEKTRYGIIIPEKIEYMLAEYTHYSERAFGNKMCVQIPKADFANLVKVKRITHR